MAIDRTIDLFEALVHDGGVRPLSAIAAELGLPSSTAYRMVTLLVRRGLLVSVRRGHYRAGLGLYDLAEQSDPHRILADVARPLLQRLARETGVTAHLGVWDSDMVTYLVKEARRGAGLFTREGGQLEAYCSAIGKVLLANLPIETRHTYLSTGPFVALTERTITEPARLEAMLGQVAQDGFAIDDREIADDLICVAVPLRRRCGDVIAAISISSQEACEPLHEPPPELLRCAQMISAKLGGRGNWDRNASGGHFATL